MNWQPATLAYPAGSMGEEVETTWRERLSAAIERERQAMLAHKPAVVCFVSDADFRDALHEAMEATRARAAAREPTPVERKFCGRQ